MFRTRLSRFFAAAIVIAFSTCLGLLVVEVGLRLILTGRITFTAVAPQSSIVDPHPTRGWTPRPNVKRTVQTLDFAVTSRTNSRGLHDIEHTYEKPEGVFRILVLGDSFMSTDYVERDDCAPRLLDTMLGPGVEVINLGVTGYGTTQEYLYFIEEGVKYDPDLVLLAFFSFNDVRNNSKQLESRMWEPDDHNGWGRPYASLRPELKFNYPDVNRVRESMKVLRTRWERETALKPWYTRTMTGAKIVHILSSSTQSPTYDPKVFLGACLDLDDARAADGFAYARAWSEAWDVTMALFDATAQAAKDAGARFAVFTVPARLQVDRPYQELILAQHPELKFNLTKYEDLLKAAAQEQGLAVLDLLPAFNSAQQTQQLFYQIQDSHWNATGHHVAAQALTELLLKNPDLLPHQAQRTE